MRFPLKKIKIFYAALLAAFSLANALILAADIFSVQKRREDSRIFYFAGMRFSGLKDFLKGADYIGYYTDKNLSKSEYAAQFSQAQYILAPVILDLNNTSHRFILFDCTTEKKAFEKIKEIGAVAVKKNPYGIVLAENRPKK